MVLSRRVKQRSTLPKGRVLFLYFAWSISSTADVQGRALCPGSTPGAPLLPFGSRRGILYSGVRGQETGGKI